MSFRMDRRTDKWNIFFLRIKIPPAFLPEGPTDNQSALLQVMILYQTAANPLPELIKIKKNIYIYICIYINWNDICICAIYKSLHW